MNDRASKIIHYDRLNLYEGKEYLETFPKIMVINIFEALEFWGEFEVNLISHLDPK